MASLLTLGPLFRKGFRNKFLKKLKENKKLFLSLECQSGSLQDPSLTGAEETSLGGDPRFPVLSAFNFLQK